MEKEAIFGASSAHNVSQNVSQILVQKQLFTSRFLVGRGEPIRYDNGARNESNFKRTDLNHDTTFAQVTQTFSRELVEAMSDPIVGADPGIAGDGGGEIGDACSCFDTVQGDVWATYYYSIN